jgi:enamine deaminase RidA (YjgF/YER057c/UK114 family)
VTLTHINPDTLYKPHGFSHVVVAEGTRLVVIGGQLASELDGSIAGENDYEAQGERALLNFGEAMKAAGAPMESLAKMTIYLVDLNADNQEKMFAGFGRAAKAIGLRKNATLVVGVSALGAPGALVEIDGLAFF